MDNTPTPIYPEEIAAVRAEILHAFRKVKRPKAKALFDTKYGKPYNKKMVKKALARKKFDEVNPEFLKEHWSQYNALSAKAYRYYFPAKLLYTLKHISNKSLVHSTIWNIAPDYSWLYYTGKAEQFDYQTSLFTTKQMKAVCSFLGLTAKTLTGFPYLNAQALRWGWGRVDHQVVDECNAYFHNLHNFTYPPAKSPKIAEIIAQIHSGFADTPYPSDDEPEQESDIREQLMDHGSIFDEQSRYRLAFRGLDWRTLHPQFLAIHYSGLIWLSDEAFRYFLPAYLIASIHDDESVWVGSNADPVFHLTCYFHQEIWDEAIWNEKIEKIRNGTEIEKTTFTKKERKAYLNRSREEELEEHRIDSMKRFAVFAKLEREAIIAYLQYWLHKSEKVHPYKDDSYSVRIKAALDNYWLKTI
jgi:hypothetical protein